MAFQAMMVDQMVYRLRIKLMVFVDCSYHLRLSDFVHEALSLDLEYPVSGYGEAR